MERKIMVQLSDSVESAWTQKALYYACILARKERGEVILVTMHPVQHFGWLGTPFGSMDFTEQERQTLNACRMTAEDYGVPFRSIVFQYYSLPGALVDAADYVDANIVFATLPGSSIPYWT